MKPTSRISLVSLLAVSGSVLGVASAALAQAPTVVHVSGATLLENLLQVRASTNDYIDADGNGIALAGGFGNGLQQLAPYVLPSATGSAADWTNGGLITAPHWAVLYSASGSGNGFQELINLGNTFSTTDSQSVSACVPAYTYDPAGPLVVGSPVGSQASTDVTVAFRSRAYYNRYRFVNGSNTDNAGGDGASIAPTALLNDANPGGFPFRADFTGWNANPALSTATYKAVFTTRGNTSGARDNFTSTCTIGSPATASRLALRGEAAPVGFPSTGGVDGLPAGLVGGMSVDVAIMDVPTTYFATQTGAGAVAKTPLAAGYGNNTRLAVNANGSLTSTNGAFNNGGGNKLAALGSAVLAASPSGSYPSGFEGSTATNVLFNTPLVFAPIAPVVNFGTFNAADKTSVRMTELQHLFATGRLPTGENLVVVTRDSGSGTRNAFQNAIGQDPSFGIGDNVGGRNNSDPESQAGSSFVPSNKGSNDRVELALINNRLAIGYVGPERGLPGGASGATAQWQSTGRLEIASVINDLTNYGGTVATRPTLDNLLNNDTAGNANAWVIGGPAVFVTFGDPSSAPAAKGGMGWTGAEPRPGSLNPSMRNVEAASFVNNITRSIKQFTEVPGGSETDFSPGEWCATRFILVAAQDKIQKGDDPTVQLANPGYNATLASWYTGTAGVSIYSSPLLNTFGSSVRPLGVNARAGKAPTRVVAATYSDNAFAAGTSFVRGVNGATIAYNANLPLRNLVTGDFSGDGKRDINDAVEIVRAEKARRTGDVAYVAPAIPGGSLLTTLAASTGEALSAGDISFEILGDFNTDGSFNKADVRYFADGLAIDASTGRLNRKAAFIAIDNAAVAAGEALPYFPTTLSTGKAYVAGDARGDIAKTARNTGSNAVGLQRFQTTRGYAPTADGVIDASDIDYVIANLVAANGGNALPNLAATGISADWATLGQAVNVDLSSDINGDRVIDGADLRELVVDILGTRLGDLNLDGKVNLADRQIVVDGTATAPATISYATGDVNGDGIVNASDRTTLCVGDYSRDGTLNIDDIFIFLNAWFSGSPTVDITNTSGVNIDDIFVYLNVWFGGCSY